MDRSDSPVRPAVHERSRPRRPAPDRSQPRRRLRLQDRSAVLQQILAGVSTAPVPRELLVGIETSDDAAVYRINDRQAIVATTDFFMPIVDDPFDFGAIAATNAHLRRLRDGRDAAVRARAGRHAGRQASGRHRSAGSSRAASRSARRPASRSQADTRSTRPSRSTAWSPSASSIPKKLKRNAGARPGDTLVLGKPLGVGIYSAALKKGRLAADRLRDDGSDARRSSTRRASRSAELDAVHALTDVTGFGFLGHLLEMCRASERARELRLRSRSAARRACSSWRARASSRAHRDATGRATATRCRSARASASCERALLTDPQTSGGLLVACAPRRGGSTCSHSSARKGFARRRDRRDRRRSAPASRSTRSATATDRRCPSEDRLAR